MAASMNAPLYTTEILRLAASLRDPRILDREDGRADVRSPTCGSRIALAVQLDPEGRVQALSQQVHACAFGQASAAILEQGAAGRSAGEIDSTMAELGDWLTCSREDPGEWPGLASLSPARSRASRHGAILLPFRALAAAMRQAGG